MALLLGEGPEMQVRPHERANKMRNRTIKFCSLDYVLQNSLLSLQGERQQKWAALYFGKIPIILTQQLCFFRGGV